MADKDTGHLAATKATLTPADIYNVSFAVSLTGYSRKEVDGFLERVGDSYAVLLAENRELQEEIAQLHHALEEYRARESALQEALRKADTRTSQTRSRTDHSARRPSRTRSPLACVRTYRRPTAAYFDIGNGTRPTFPGFTHRASNTHAAAAGMGALGKFCSS